MPRGCRLRAPALSSESCSSRGSGCMKGMLTPRQRTAFAELRPQLGPPWMPPIWAGGLHLSRGVPRTLGQKPHRRQACESARSRQRHEGARSPLLDLQTAETDASCWICDFLAPSDPTQQTFSGTSTCRYYNMPCHDRTCMLDATARCAALRCAAL